MTSHSRQLNADINVTPFLDVLLVLIITFLSMSMTRKSMDVQLPVPCTGTCLSKDASIVLEVLADESFLLNRQPVSVSALVTALRSVFDGRPEKILQVAGHRDVSYQAVLSAMDAARSAGVTVISIPPSKSYLATH